MADFSWDSDIRATIVKRGWRGWSETNREAITSTVRLQTPVLTGETRKSVRSRYTGGGLFGTKKLVIEATTPWSKLVHDGRKGFSAKKGPFLTWLVGLGHSVPNGGGYIGGIPKGKRVKVRRVGPAAADPFILRGVELFLGKGSVKGWRRAPGSKPPKRT